MLRIRLIRLSFVLFLLLVLSACGGGGSSSGDGNGGGQTQQFDEMTDVTVVYSDTPIQNQEATISLISPNTIEEISWVIVSEPPTSNLVLSTSVDNKTVTFTASVPGEYQISARSVGESTEKSTSFTVMPVFAFDESKIEGNDDLVNIDEIIGIIKNQSWVRSSSLTENQLRELVASYSFFTVIGYDSILGLLIEYDETDIVVTEALEKLKNEKGVSGVNNRVHRGEKTPINLAAPIDGNGFSQSDWNDNSGENWHLEFVGLPNAWEYTTGSKNVLIGIVESHGSGFFRDHEDISGRFEVIFSNKTADHGMGVAGAIAANTDNELGISGVNWVSNIVAGTRPIIDNIIFPGRPIGNAKVKVINNSWSMTKYPPVTFDPSNQTAANERQNFAESRTDDYRVITEVFSDELFVWAAGNGIDNGCGNGVFCGDTNGVFGVDARFHNGAIHYKDGELAKVNNVLVVGALVKDGRLTALSEYGSSVDIAAPTRYVSLRASNSGYWTSDIYGSNVDAVIREAFNETSAAAPIVSGVASLIYSLYTGFTGEEVKDILISTATEFVTERYVAPGPAGLNNTNIEPLAHPIPILNAAKALEKAQQIVDNKIRLKYSIPGPFTPQARIEFKSIDQDFEVVGLEWNLESKADSGATWNFVSNMAVDGKIAEPMLDANILDYRLVTTVTLRNKNDTSIEVTSNSAYEFSYSNISVSAGENFNTIQEALFAGVIFEVENLLDSPFTQTRETGADGMVSVYLKSGVYKLRGNLSGYDEIVKLLVINDPQLQQIDFHMTETKTDGLLQIKYPNFAAPQVALRDAPNNFFSNVLCLANNGTKISIPSNPEDVCDSTDTLNTTNPLLHKCPLFSPWLRLDPDDVSCSVAGNSSLYVSLGSVEYAGDVSGFSYYLENTGSGVTRIIDKPDLLNGKTLCWAVARTPVVYRGEVADLQFPAIKWADVDYSGIDLWVGGCKKGQRGYVGTDTVFNY